MDSDPLREPLLPLVGTSLTNRHQDRHYRRQRRLVGWLAVSFLFTITTAAFSFAIAPRQSATAAQAAGPHAILSRWSPVAAVQGPQSQERDREEERREDASATTTTTTITTLTTSAANPSATVLKTFEVSQPVRMPDGPAESDGSTRHGWEYQPPLCTKLLMRHDFAWSYEAPFVGNYTPPDCEFNRVVLNFSAVVHGRQYDRLAIMYFGDTEVWRTSTAQPTPPPGISWIYLKDMTEYLYFWKSPQKIIFDLGNLINEKYTGIFNTTMTAIFYKDDNVATDQAPPSDMVIPISARRGAENGVSRFMLPNEKAANTIVLPRNIRRAVFTVSANGQASEEFWWSNVLQGDELAFDLTAGPLPGLSPFREVQVYIDGHLAGVQWPFPVIFTGGVVPALHRPIVGIHAFDLREHEIDISPFLPLLNDGQPHTFEIRVAGVQKSANGSLALTETINDHWFATGKLFLWLSEDSEGNSDDNDASYRSTSGLPTIHSPPPTISIARSLTTAPNGTNETLTFTTSVRRTLFITSGSSDSSRSSWSQSLAYTNHAIVSDFGFTQYNNVSITGSDAAISSPQRHRGSSSRSESDLPSPYYQAVYSYPLECTSTYSFSPQGNLSISATLAQGKRTAVTGQSVFASGLEAFAPSLSPSSSSSSGRGRPVVVVKGATALLDTAKRGKAEYRQTGDGMASTGWGDVRQEFWFGVLDGSVGAGVDILEGGRERGRELYAREVRSVNGTVVEDDKRLAGRRIAVMLNGEGREAGEAYPAVEYA
ncbi:hypothetical protein VTJ83DRAFT_7223 [Remersonia thermophila]|uniref:Peptide N-acetyl-beta-D-glucosaminyl asparaginase amidase A N-terminal domain-containing protein n=1 Tax=Remersonia thermophila TaxID=72144 RepID=A0ABR4D2V7_9PEZI